MKKWAVGLLAMLVVLSGTAVPSDAWVRGGGFHHGFHGGCCWGGWWWPGAFVGGVALGTVASTYPYPYYYVPYAPSTVVYPQAPTYAALTCRVHASRGLILMERFFMGRD